MQYEDILIGTFVKRLNRFTALVDIAGCSSNCHVKNTGRLRELLLPGAKVILEKSKNKNRKTAYSLISVYKGDTLVNIDSTAPNQVVYEWIKAGGLIPTPTLLKREQTFGNSRFDLYAEYENRKAFIEVKGVTLEVDHIAYFPDAPTERGVKHIEELIQCVQQGYDAFAVFVIQLDGVTTFRPNQTTHPAFQKALLRAQQAGVQIKAVLCHVDISELIITKEIPIHLA